MCWMVKVGDTWCSTIGELRKALYPRANAIAYHVYYDFPEARRADSCLCPVNKEATAAALGLTCTQIEGGDHVFAA